MQCVFSYFFFFKQKTAYEMRISDWSSDVCSSDLAARPAALDVQLLQHAVLDHRDAGFARGDVDQNLLCHPKQLLSTITASSPTALHARYQLPLPRLRARDGVRERKVARNQPRFRTPPTVQQLRTATSPQSPNRGRERQNAAEGK